MSLRRYQAVGVVPKLLAFIVKMGIGIPASSINIHGCIVVPGLSFKPDASFFRKIVVGAVGARAVVSDLALHGHQVLELERGSTDTKLWKDVKRKRVRIPDLVCVNCGRRIECRAKTKLELAMSHSPTAAERAWDYGMVDADWIAFPVCLAADEVDQSAGALSGGLSYWRQKNWVNWQATGTINYFTVEAFRSRMHERTRTKGVEEGSENVIAWDATFATREGVVDAVNHADGKVTVRRNSDGRRHTWTIKGDKQIVVLPEQQVGVSTVLAAAVAPISISQLPCPGSLPADRIPCLLSSRERTQRFTGVKLARLLRNDLFASEARTLAGDAEEDVYVRLEAASYLTSVCNESANELVMPYLESADEQNQLEAVIALGEAASEQATEILCDIVSSNGRPFFLRSAAAWSLSRTGCDAANQQLVQCFRDIDVSLREEALEGIVSIGGAAFPILLQGLRGNDNGILAGCAEALRRADRLPSEVIDHLIAEINSEDPQQWAVWLVAHLPREHFASAIAELQRDRPQLHYAISLLWSFVESWIARNWELHPNPVMPREH